MSIYETHTMKNPSLPFILHETHRPHVYTDAIGNWHENVEILCFSEGGATVSSNEQRFSVCAGELAVLNANCIHTISCEEGVRYYCLIVDRAFCLSNHFDTNRIRFSEHIRDGELFALFEELAREWNTDEDSPFRVQVIRALVLRIMALLCRRHSLPDGESQADSHLLSCMKQAIGHIHSESHRNLSLDDLSHLVGLSKFYFAREFRNITGYTVVSYINLVRCEKAKRLLSEESLGIGEVGRVCGFPNPSYFSRTFLTNVGISPGEYRKRACAKGAVT